MPIIPINAATVKNVVVFSCNESTAGAKVEFEGTAASITGIKFPRTITNTYNTINIVAIAIRLPFKSPFDFLLNNLSNGLRPPSIIMPPKSL
jgi:hypothetical protein